MFDKGEEPGVAGIIVNFYVRKKGGGYELAATEKTGVIKEDWGGDKGKGGWHMEKKNAGRWAVPKQPGLSYYLSMKDLKYGYFEYIYNNKIIYTDETKKEVKQNAYVPIKPYVGNKKVRSTAIPDTITQEELKDDNLTGQEGEYPGRAVQYGIGESQGGGVFYYNFGLREQVDPEFKVEQNLAYIKLKMDGYEHTYDYRNTEPEQITYKAEQGTNEQIPDKKSFSLKLYPSDLANVDKNNLEISAIYKIDVKNTETTSDDGVYNEQKLYLTSLSDKFNSDIFEIDTEPDELAIGSTLWESEGGTAKYQNNEDGIVAGDYSNGIGKGETVSTYIKLRLKKDVTKRILDDINSNQEDFVENVASKATATGYHEYLRTDFVIEHKDNVRDFEGSKSEHPDKNGEGDKYYLHRTTDKTYESLQVALRFRLNEQRVISGTVFEDEDIPKEADEDYDGEGNRNLGNGILDDAEKNRAESVKVELLDLSTLWEPTKNWTPENWSDENLNLQPTKIYKTNGESVSAVTQTNPDDGTYRFEGVVPGDYLIRFTYGDGTQKMKTLDSADSYQIYSRDYKSTIINTDSDVIKKAMEMSADEIKEARANGEQYGEWYKYLDNKNYSTATDELSKRIATKDYVYHEDGTVSDGAGNVYKYTTNDGTISVTDKDGNENGELQSKLLVSAYTPVTGISIENTIDNRTEGDTHYAVFDKFNFGLIKEAKNEITMEKKITNVRFTTQVGSTIINQNPTDKNKSIYVSSLEDLNGGSTYAKLELDTATMPIYGSEIAVTYQITITNTEASDIDFIEDEDSSEYGQYFRYGIISDEVREKKIKTEQVIDELDKKYYYESIIGENTGENKVEEIHIASNGSETRIEGDEKVKVEQIEASGTPQGKYLSITDWAGISRGESVLIKYTATSQISDSQLASTDELDTAYKNNAKIESLSTESFSTLTNQFSNNWGSMLTSKDTIIAITPATGKDKSNLYLVEGAIGLIALVMGIALLKKKVLK